MWVCPHCRLPLLASPGAAALACANRHSFDRAREGYCNLLPAHHKRTPNPGDDPRMVAARRRVHGADAYRPLADALVSELAVLAPAGAILDLGCGEGYYCKALAAGLPGCSLYGVDISRAAVRLAARACREADFAVASAYRLPLADDSLGAIVRVFAPSDDREVVRTLRPGGYYLEVSPAPGHLREVRERLYATPREHAVPRCAISGLEPLGQRALQYRLAVDTALLADIVGMSPFAWRGHRERRDSLLEDAPPAVTLAFSLSLFQAVA